MTRRIIWGVTAVLSVGLLIVAQVVIWEIGRTFDMQAFKTWYVILLSVIAGAALVHLLRRRGFRA